MYRRQFLTLPLFMLLAPFARAVAAPPQTRGWYTADVGVLYDMLTFHLEGSIEEMIDRQNGRYHVVIAGEGPSISNRLDASGILQQGRWVPIHSESWFNVR